MLFEYSGFLLIGTVVALIWANASPDKTENGTVVEHGGYSHFVHLPLFGADHHEDHGEDHGEDHHEDHDEDHDHGKQDDRGHNDSEHSPSSSSSSSDEHAETSDSHAKAEPHDWQSGSILQRIFVKIVNRPDAKGVFHGITIHFLINDILMAFFFAIAAKEVRESLLPGGALSNARKAATPLLATLGGIVGPAGLYLLGAYLAGQWTGLSRGWAIPCATDIAFSYLIARWIFGRGHPAIAFLLLLAIADDAAGLIILAVAYPQGEPQFAWLFLTVVAVAIGFGFRRLRLQSFWWYILIPGTLSWISFDLAGIHAALGLVPVIICMPHAHTDLGTFAREELKRKDTLNAFEHWWKNPVEIILGLFGLANAGVVMSSVGTGTWLVLLGLLVGKPLGITVFTWVAQRLLGLEIPAGMNYRHVVSLGMVAAIGFTVALFVSTAAFDGSNPALAPYLDSAKMGALLSFIAAPIAFFLARSLGVRPDSKDGETEA